MDTKVKFKVRNVKIGKKDVSYKDYLQNIYGIKPGYCIYDFEKMSGDMTKPTMWLCAQ